MFIIFIIIFIHCRNCWSVTIPHKAGEFQRICKWLGGYHAFYSRIAMQWIAASCSFLTNERLSRIGIMEKYDWRRLE